MRLMLFYGCETWVFKKASEKLVSAFERKILRKILGPVHKEG